MTTLNELQQKYLDFISERDWEEFHRPKNISMALSVEAGELMELFQWTDNVESEKLREDEELVEDARDEVADILMYLLSLSNELGIDPVEAAEEKLDRNDERFSSEDMDRWRK